MAAAMRRGLVCLVMFAAAAAACSRTPQPRGPEHPMSVQALSLDDSRIAGQARSAALAFLRAYARSPADDGRALDQLTTGVLAQEWAHLQAVQNAGFPGTIDGTLRLTFLGPATPVRAEDGSLDNFVAYGVTVQATVTFAFSRDDSASPPPPLARAMDGLIVLVMAPDRGFRVLNFERDGLRLDEFFHVFDGATEHRDGVTVQIRNMVQLERWQFGIEITNDTRRPLHVVRDLTALLTASEEPATVEPPLVTFPRSIPPGVSAEGIVSFTPPSETVSLDLQIAVAEAGREATGFVFRVPEPAGTETVAPSPSP